MDEWFTGGHHAGNSRLAGSGIGSASSGRWLALSVGTLFLLIGVFGFLTIGGVVPAGIPFWIVKLSTALFALFGGVILAWAIGSIISPAHVRHAAPDVLPNVPKEPVIREGSVVHGRLTHELWEDVHGWQFRPAEHLGETTRGFCLALEFPFWRFSPGY